MRTEKWFYETTEELENTPSIRQQLLASLSSSKEYRHAFVEEKIRSGLAAQVKGMREKEGKSQTDLARSLGKAQSWISRLEDPNAPIPTIPTLLAVAMFYDVDLEVRFAPFSEMLDRLSDQTPETLNVPSFKEDDFEEREAPAGFKNNVILMPCPATTVQKVKVVAGSSSASIEPERKPPEQIALPFHYNGKEYKRCPITTLEMR